MKVFSEALTVQTGEPLELIDITKRIKDLLKSSNIKDGLANLVSLHTTTAVLLNEAQQALLDDLRGFIKGIVDDAAPFKHNDPDYSDCDRHNASSHVRGLAFGQTLTVPILDGKLVLGRWQAILFAEFDGPQKRQLQVQLVGE
ncbi:MAG TPA: secondary thiamine-phosphate synthase enzyme YjbQ [Armatimonadota bacterium]|jgi:secondary thiamine-phosphate synthase enzyme